MQFPVGAEVLKQQFVFPRAAPGQDGRRPQFVDVVRDRGVGQDLVGGILNNHMARGQACGGLGDGKQVFFQQRQHFTLVTARLDPVLGDRQEPVPVGSRVHQQQPRARCAQQFFGVSQLFAASLDRNNRRRVLQEPAQRRQSRAATDADQQDKGCAGVGRFIVGIDDQEPFDCRTLRGGPHDEGGETQGEIRKDIVHRNRDHGFLLRRPPGRLCPVTSWYRRDFPRNM